MNFFTKILIVYLLALATVSCSKNPVTGKKELTFISENYEIQLGTKNYLALQEASGGDFTTFPEITSYVESVGMSLARVSDRPQLPYSFVIIDNSSPNAWALPGGKIAINRGLLIELESEAELAAVLAHEIVHAAARHSAKAIERNSILVTGLIGVNEIFKSKQYSTILMGSLTTGITLITFKYSRRAEMEADKYGMLYMVRAGYNPEAAVSLQEKFMALSEEKNRQWLEGLFSTHPPSYERIEANKKTLTLYPLSGKIGHDTYLDIMRPLKETADLYKEIDKNLDELDKGNIESAYISAQHAVHALPQEPRTHALLGKTLYAKGDDDKALQEFDRAIALNDHYFDYYLQRGLIYFDKKEYDRAITDLNKSIELLPTSSAHITLGHIYRLRNDKNNALLNYNRAASDESTTGAHARAWQEWLDLPTNAEKYIGITPYFSKSGYLQLDITNHSSLRIAAMTIDISILSHDGTVILNRRVSCDNDIAGTSKISLATTIRNVAGADAVVTKISSLQIADQPPLF